VFNFNATGTARIKKVTGKFINMINELKLGAKEIKSEINSNKVIISGLVADNDKLDAMQTEAENLIKDLTKLVKGE